MRTVKIPDFLIKKTFFWSPGGSAAQRRANEKRRNAEIEAFLSALPQIPGLEVYAGYSESCKNVYKTFSVYRNGKKSNVRGLIAECKKHGVELIK